jgi:hypothetical protein
VLGVVDCVALLIVLFLLFLVLLLVVGSLFFSGVCSGLVLWEPLDASASIVAAHEWDCSGRKGYSRGNSTPPCGQHGRHQLEQLWHSL